MDGIVFRRDSVSSDRGNDFCGDMVWNLSNNLHPQNFPKNKKGKISHSGEALRLGKDNMTKRVEIERSYSDCKTCNDIAEMYDQIPDCSHCKRQKGEWIGTITNLFGTKAVVILDDGKVEQFPLSQIKVITKKEA